MSRAFAEENARRKKKEEEERRASSSSNYINRNTSGQHGGNRRYVNDKSMYRRNEALNQARANQNVNKDKYINEPKKNETRRNLDEIRRAQTKAPSGAEQNTRRIWNDKSQAAVSTATGKTREERAKENGSVLKNAVSVGKESAKQVFINDAITATDIGSENKWRQRSVDVNANDENIQPLKEDVERAKKAKQDYQKLLKKRDESEQKIQDITKDAKGLEKAVYGAVESGVGMASDIAFGPAALAHMGVRSYGAQRGKAQAEGATEAEDRWNAFVQAGKEVGTEMMFRGAGIAKKVVGSKGLSLADKAADIFTRNMTGKKADLVSAAVRFGGGVGEENVEELAGWGLDPLITELTYGRNVRIREAEDRLRQESDALRSNITDANTARAAAAYLSSDDFIEKNKKAYMDSGIGEKEAESLAGMMRDYLTASLTGDTRSMADLQDEISRTVAGKKKMEWDVGELRDTIAATTLLTAVTGAPGAVSTHSQGQAIKDYFGTEGIEALTKTAVDFEDEEMSIKAQAMRDRLASGKDITSTQAYDLSVGLRRQAIKDDKREQAFIQTAEGNIKRENLVPALSVDQDGGVYLGELTGKAYDREKTSAENMIRDWISKMTDEGMSLTDTEIYDGAKAIAAFKTGAFTVADANQLNFSNQTVRTAFREATGIDLNQYIVRGRDGSVDIPRTNTATKNALFAMAADNLVKSSRMETENWMDNEKGQVVTEISSRMGTEGSMALQEALDGVDERDRSNYLMTANAVDFLYHAGRNTGSKWEDVEQDLVQSFPDVKPEALHAMYEAGLRDRDAALDTARGRQIRIGESISNISSEKVEQKGELLIETKIAPNGSTVRLFSEVARSLGVKIHLVDDLPIDKEGTRQANGQYKDGEIWLNVNSSYEKNVGYIAMHEITHHLKLYAPEQYQALENLVREKWFEKDPDQMQDMIRQKIEAYKKAGQTLTEEQALEEIIADSAHEFLTDRNFAKQVCDSDISLGKAVINAIRSAIRGLFRVFGTGGISDTYMDSLFSQLGILEEAEKLWLEAYKQAAANQAAIGLMEWDVNSHSIVTVMDGKGTRYDNVVKLDSSVFNGIEENDSKERSERLRKYLYSHAGMQMTMYDNNGNPESVRLARYNEKARKAGSKSKNRVINKMATASGIKQLFVTNVSEITEASSETDRTKDNTHGWLDKNGWQHREAFAVDSDGTLWRMKLSIADSANGMILYEISDINEEASGVHTTPSLTSNNNIPQTGQEGKRNSITGDELEGKDREDGGGVRFSFTSPVERVKDLIAVHNLKAEDLKGAFDLGGFPMPSIAVTKDSMGHDKYGDISLLFGSDTIDPERRGSNELYGGDAYTPTFPAIRYKPNEKVEDRIRDMYYENARKIGYDAMRPFYDLGNTVEDALNSAGGEEALKEKYRGDTSAMRAFLKMNDKDVEDIITRTETTMSDAEIELNQFFIDSLGEDVLRTFKPEGVRGSSLISYRKEWIQDHKEALEKAYGDFFRQGAFSFSEEQIRNVLDAFRPGDYAKAVRNALNYLDNGPITVKEEVDRKATNEAVEKAAADLGYENWINDLLDGIEEKQGIRNNQDFFTRSGNRRKWEVLHDPVTLENVVRIMRSELAAGGNGLFGANPKGAAQKQYRSLDEARADEDRLQMLPEEEYERLSGEAMNKFVAVCQSIYNHNESLFNNSFGGTMDIGEGIAEVLNATRTKDGIKRKLTKEFHWKVTDQEMDDLMDAIDAIANVPTGYFESKPRRAVGFDEIKAAVVPASMDEEIKTGLADRGVSIYEYDPKTEGDRAAKLNQALDEKELRFSITPEQDKEYMAAVNDGDMETAQRMVDDAAKKAMPNTKLNGRWFHGTNNNFNIFDFSEGGKNGTAEGFGIYLAKNQEVSEHYGDRLISGYVNITRPASSNKRTIRVTELRQLIRATVDEEARTIAEDYDGDINAAMKDTWISNYTNTYDKSMSAAIDDVARSILRLNDNDMGIVQEIMAGMAIRDYDQASRFYDMLTDVTGIDGFLTYWDNPDNAIALAFRSNQIKSADPVTYDDNGDVIPLSDRFNEKNPDIRYSITSGMTEEERYQELKDKTINVPIYNAEKMPKGEEDLYRLRTQMKKDALPILRRIASEMGITDRNKAYSTTDLDVEFYYSNNRLDESAQKQAVIDSDEKYILFAKMLTCFDDVVNNAKLIEAHKDRYAGTKRGNTDFRMAYVLVSAFLDEEGIVPVKLLVKDNNIDRSTLHVSIALPKIKRADQHGQANRNDQRSPLSVLSDYSLAELLRAVKRIDESENGTKGSVMGKYIPSQFLDSRSIYYSIPPEDDAISQLAEEAANLDEIPLDDPVLEEGRIRMAKSKQDFVNSLNAIWNERWLTEGKILDIKSVRTDIRKLVMSVMQDSDTDSQYKTEVVESAFRAAKSAYWLLKDKKTGEAAELLWNTARGMIENVDFVNDEMFNQYKELRDYLRKTDIKVGPEYQSDIHFNEFKKRNFGRLRLKKGPTNIDNVYKELAEQWPEFFNEEEVSNPADQLYQIEDVLDKIQPYKEAYSSEQAKDLAWDIAEDLLNIVYQGKEYVSVADKYKAKYEQKTKAMKARHQEAIKKIKQQRDERVKKEREKLKAYKEKQRDTKERARRFGSIEKNYTWLAKRLVEPNKDEGIPEEFRRSLAELLYMFDFQTEASRRLEKKYGIASKNKFKIWELKARYEEIAKEDDSGILIYDGTLIQIMQDLADRIDGTSIDQLTTEDLIALDTIMNALVHNMREFNKIRIRGKEIEIQDIGEDTIASLKNRIAKYGKRKTYIGTRGLLDRLVNEGEETPVYFFERIGGGMETMFQELRKGNDQHIRNMAMIRSRFEQICGEFFNKKKPGSELEKWRDSTKAEPFELSHGQITLTPAQIMSLYCLSKRQQALGHILGAGIVSAPISTGAKLADQFKGKEEQVESLMISYADLHKILGSLTDEQIRIADDLQSLLNNEMAAWGNETSMKLYGYKQFREQNYFPIKVSGEVLSKDVNNISPETLERIKNFGFAKSTIRGANNAIMLDDIFSVVADHCNKMSLYNAFAIPITDFMRVYNYKQKGAEAGGKSVQALIGEAFTRKANTYIMKFMADVNGNTQTKSDALNDIMGKALANYKKASIGANFRVALQQPTAIFRAFMVLDPKYFTGVRIRKGAMQEMFDHCPIALWKKWGHYDVDLGRDVEDIMMNRDWSKWDTLTMGIYGGLDNMAWCAIWQAVKNEVKEKHPEVEAGSNEFWDLCNERASEVFDKTQVVDSIFHRSDIMRSKNAWAKMLTSFMAEPTLTYNCFRDSLVHAAEMWKDGDQAGAVKIMSRMTIVLLLNAAAVSASAALWDVVRGKDPESLARTMIEKLRGDDGDDDDDEELTWQEQWFHNFLANFCDNANLINNIYFVKDIYGLKDGFGTQNLALEGYEELWRGLGQMKKKITGQERKGNEKTWYEIGENTIGGIGHITGVPTKTIMRDAKFIYDRWLAKAFAANDVYYETLKDGTVLEFSSEKEAAEARKEYTATGELAGGGINYGSPNAIGQFFDAIFNGKGSIKGSEEEPGKEEKKASKSSKEEEPAKVVYKPSGETVEFTKEGKLKQKAFRDMSYAEKVKYINTKYANLPKSQRTEKVWSMISEGYNEYIERGDYAYIKELRKIMQYTGGDLEEFDRKVLEASQRAYKKTIVSDPDGFQIDRQDSIRDYLLENGMSAEDISAMCYKSAVAKDLKAALRLNNEEYIINEYSTLIRAGLTYDDFAKLYENRNLGRDKYTGKYAKEESEISTGRLTWPSNGIITSGFGSRTAPTKGASSYHQAIDIGGSIGDPIRAADGGTVIYAGWYGGYGYQVRIRHQDGTETRYSHLNGYSVKPGDVVRQGDQIAEMGSTGVSTGPHLDFQVRVDDRFVNPLDYIQS